MAGELVDARGVEIFPGDKVVWGFGVSRSVAMAEGVVMADLANGGPLLTPSGRVKVRVIRRSYASGEKPVVDLAADRLVVVDKLPESPLPTQDERAREEIEGRMGTYKADLRITDPSLLPSYWHGDLLAAHAHAAQQLSKLRAKLKGLDGGEVR